MAIEVIRSSDSWAVVAAVTISERALAADYEWVSIDDVCFAPFGTRDIASDDEDEAP